MLTLEKGERLGIDLSVLVPFPEGSAKTPVSLLAVLASVPDPPSRKGCIDPLPAILSLTVVAMLAGNKTLEAIAQFGRDHGTPLAHALGFRRGKTPAKGTLSQLFRRLDLDAFEEALSRWLLGRVAQGWEAIAIDGKTLRGTRTAKPRASTC